MGGIEQPLNPRKKKAITRTHCIELAAEVLMNTAEENMNGKLSLEELEVSK